MELKLKVVRSDETYEVIAGPRAVNAYEEKHGKSILDFAKGTFQVSDIWKLAYEATRIAGKVVPSKFPEWLDGLVSVEEVEDQTPDPTVAAPTATE